MKFVSSVLSTIFGTEDLKAMAELEREDPDNAEEIIAQNKTDEDLDVEQDRVVTED